MASTLYMVVVTGMSGAGRSTALHVLDDLGFFCVDNLPPRLAPELVGLLVRDQRFERIGLGIDVRTGAFLEGATEVLDQLSASGHEVEVLFLDATDETLLRRFSETRRPHPLAHGGDVSDGIQRERERTAALRARATHIVDTTSFRVHDLRRHLVDFVAQSGARPKMVTRVVSFGFKYGLPVDADLVFDLRYLPNPYFEPELRSRSGLDEPVARFVLGAEETSGLLAELDGLLAYLLPRYEKEGKAYLTIAVGCTGGRHRSVAVAEELGRRLGPGREVLVAHRDMGRGGG